MGNENGTWIMHGVTADDPECLHTVDEAIEYIDKVGFLPLFQNDIEGFSLEEHTIASHWWCDDEELDPWTWRQIIARSGKVAYGKFFEKKAGFISLKWLPYFVNYRRDGYDFDARWEDEMASGRQKKIMDLYDEKEALFSFEIKKLAGFGKGGEKNFEGTITDLQMQTYLVVEDFKQKKNKKGELYGWHVAVYSKPEQIWGREAVVSRYCESPDTSGESIANHIRELYPYATERQIQKMLGKKGF